MIHLLIIVGVIFFVIVAGVAIYCRMVYSAMLDEIDTKTMAHK